MWRGSLLAAPVHAGGGAAWRGAADRPTTCDSSHPMAPPACGPSADGRFGGSLIHSPNIYDFPVSLQIARILGGDAVWVHDGQSVHFDELWMDDRADMLRLPGIVACSANHQTLETLVELACDWSRERYTD